MKKNRTFMNPGVSGGAVGIAGAAADEDDDAGDAGPGGGPYIWADATAERASTERANCMAAVSVEDVGVVGESLNV